MTLFGQEIDLQIDSRALGTIIVAVMIFIVIGGGVGLIFPKVVQYRSKIAERELKVEERQKTELTYKKEKAKLDKLRKIYEEQRMNLESLKERFKGASLKDETDLKIAVQKMINHLGINLSEAGASQVIEEKKSYVKKNIPYKIEGKFYNISRLFYYLENCNWLLTFRGSELGISSVSDEKDSLQVRFKVGAYIIREGGELDFE